MENRGLSSILRKTRNVKKKSIPTKILNDNSESIPDMIIVVYNEKVNVDQIDEVIRVKLKKTNSTEELEKYERLSKIKIEKYKENPTKLLLENYLDICSIFIKIERIKNVKNNFTCKACGQSLEDLKEDSDGVVTCPFLLSI